MLVNVSIQSLVRACGSFLTLLSCSIEWHGLVHNRVIRVVGPSVVTLNRFVLGKYKEFVASETGTADTPCIYLMFANYDDVNTTTGMHPSCLCNRGTCTCTAHAWHIKTCLENAPT